MGDRGEPMRDGSWDERPRVPLRSLRKTNPALECTIGGRRSFSISRTHMPVRNSTVRSCIDVIGRASAGSLPSLGEESEEENPRVSSESLKELRLRTPGSTPRSSDDAAGSQERKPRSFKLQAYRSSLEPQKPCLKNTKTKDFKKRTRTKVHFRRELSTVLDR